MSYTRLDISLRGIGFYNEADGFEVECWASACFYSTAIIL